MTGIQFRSWVSRFHILAVSFCLLVAGACGEDKDTGAQSDPLTLTDDYCTMEATCIPNCLCIGGEECACNSETRVQECNTDYERWAKQYIQQGKECKKTFYSWLECITKTSCQGVENFFQGHPDGVEDGDPCATEYFALECQDFEPMTEYGFDEESCPEGLMPGGCGLEGQCIECIVNEHCVNKGGTCLWDGKCAAVSICTTDNDCTQYLRCFDGLCVTPCSDHADCHTGSRCNGQYCYNAWCTKGGTCQSGWEPIDGSLRCTYVGDNAG